MCLIQIKLWRPQKLYLGRCPNIPPPASVLPPLQEDPLKDPFSPVQWAFVPLLLAQG